MAAVDTVLRSWPITEVRPLLDNDASTWLAGGAVRDLLLGRSPHDWDFVIEGSGLRLARAVADKLGGAYFPLDPERRTGRAIVVDRYSGRQTTLDFAALRDDTITQDLLGRDFTVNAMALSLGGKLIDPTGGLQDLRDRRLRMVSPGCFAADSVRLLRAARLATQLDLTLEAATRAQIVTEAHRIADAVPERVRAELVALMSLPSAASGLALLAELGLLDRVFRDADPIAGDVTTGFGSDPDGPASRIGVVSTLSHLQLALAQPSVVPCPEHIPACAALRANARTLGDLDTYLATPVGAEVTRAELIRWAALLIPGAPPPASSGVGQLAEHRMSLLRFSGAATDFVRLTIASRVAFDQLAVTEALTRAGIANETSVRRAIYRYFRGARDAGVAGAILALASFVSSASPDTQRTWDIVSDTALILIEAYLARRAELVDPLPLLSGHDLLELGVPPGPPVGKTAARLLEAQATGEVLTKSQARAFVSGTLEEAGLERLNWRAQ